MSKKGSAMKRYSISLTDKNIEQIATLQAELGHASISETVRAGINHIYSSTFPKYVRSNNPVQTIPEREKSPETLEKERAERNAKLAEKRKQATEQKKSNELEHCMQVCEQDLGGLVGTDEDDNPQTCSYFQYESRNRYTQEIDILSVSAELAKTQYLPNKDHVLRLQEGGHIDYDVSEKIEDVLNAE